MEATAPPTGPPADILSNVGYMKLMRLILWGDILSQYLTAASLLSELSSMSNATALSRPLPGVGYCMHFCSIIRCA